MRLTGILIVILLLAGCIPPSQTQLRMEMDLEQMKRRLAQLEIQKADAAQTDLTDGVSLQRQVAELQSGLDNMRVEFHSVNGRIDDLARNNQSLEEELGLVRDELNLQLDSLNHRLDELGTTPSSPPVTGDQGVEQGQAAAQPAPPSAEAQYEQALGLILNAGDFAEGRRQMEAFVRNNPGHDLYVNAQYWIGEALYGEKKFEMAILQFQDVISRFASHSKAPDALYKQALAFNALGDGQNARATMRKLIDTYPNSEQAKAADRFLKN
ncbi:MAG: tol-pal system protein YbgF [Pelovirga sp.]